MKCRNSVAFVPPRPADKPPGPPSAQDGRRALPGRVRASRQGFAQAEPDFDRESRRRESNPRNVPAGGFVLRESSTLLRHVPVAH